MRPFLFCAFFAVSARANFVMPGATTETRLGGAAADARSTRDRKRETRTLEYHPARFSRSAGAEAASIAGDETFERRLAQSDVCIETPSP